MGNTIDTDSSNIPVKKRSIFSKFLPHIILIGVIVLATSLWLFKYMYKAHTPPSKAAEVKPKLINGKKISDYQEVKLQPIKNVRIKLNSIAVYSSASKQKPLSTTGQWQGKDISLVPDDRFFPEYNYFTYYGITSFDMLRNNQMIIGGMDGFAYKSPNDEDWRNLILIPATQFGMSGNVILKSWQTFMHQPDTYLMGSAGLLYQDNNGGLTELTDSTLVYSHLSNLLDSALYGDNGLVTYRDEGQWRLGGALYYTEGGQIRKWFLPQPDPNYYSDQIEGIFTNPQDTTHQTFYAIVRHCTPNIIYGHQNCIPAFGGIWNTYLYQYHFNIDPNIPLDVTQLGTVTTASQHASQGHLYHMFMKPMPSNPSQYTLYSSYGPAAYRAGSNIDIIRNFQPMAANNQFSTIRVHDQNDGSQWIQYTYDSSTNDTFWFNQSDILSMYNADGFQTTDNITYHYMSAPERQMIANPYTSSISSDRKGTIYLGHNYLHGQFNNALVTIFSNPQPTPTPIVYTACNADIYRDGVVDAFDWGIIRREYGWNCMTQACQGDINHDNVVDGFDYNIVRTHYGELCEANLSPTPSK